MARIRETGKDRWKRIPTDYFKKHDGITKAKLWLSAIACVAAVGWWAYGVDWSGRGLSSTDLNSLRTNHGELARVHKAWENKCDACHEPFKPVNGRGLFSSTASADQSSDKLCMSCHTGPTHHAAMITSEVKTCAECHRDHQGRDFSMVRLVDGECTSCHSSLGDHVAAGSKVKYKDVKEFKEESKDDKGHPKFRSEHAELVNDKLQDKSKLLFNHALHMTRGLKGGEKTFEMILDEAERARYQRSAKRQGKPDALKALIELDCSSCHVLDSKDQEPAVNRAVASNPLSDRNPGLYFLPISYQNQCRACHPQTFNPLPGLAKIEVPHGVQPDEVVGFLRKVFTEKATLENAGLLNRKVTAFSSPGRQPEEVEALKLRDEAVKKTSQALFETKTGCVECHILNKEKEETPPSVVPTKVPEIWYTHALFNHTAHRGVSCRDCHSRSYALDPQGKTFQEASIVATDVLIPALDNCVKCHAPLKKAGGILASVTSTTGGVSHDCTECHRYHNGDNPLQGPGALAQDVDPKLKRSITDFLTGNRPQSTESVSTKPK